MEEVATLFGESLENLRGMSRRELTKRYRQRARKYHPDKGGSHEAFVRLNRSYRILLQRKPK
jgi:DnaJ-class molecular chaperone